MRCNEMTWTGFHFKPMQLHVMSWYEITWIVMECNAMKLYSTDCIEEGILSPDELAQGYRFQKEVPSLKSCKNQTFAKVNKTLYPLWTSFSGQQSSNDWAMETPSSSKKECRFYVSASWLTFSLSWRCGRQNDRIRMSLQLQMFQIICFKQLWAETWTANHQ